MTLQKSSKDCCSNKHLLWAYQEFGTVFQWEIKQTQNPQTTEVDEASFFNCQQKFGKKHSKRE